MERATRPTAAKSNSQHTCIRNSDWSGHRSRLRYRYDALILVGSELSAKFMFVCGHPPCLKKFRLDIVWNLPFLRNDRQPPRVPEGIRIYAIGDVHGRADLLTSLLLQIEVDTILYPIARPIVVFLGDYIDRGPDSKKVLDLLATRSSPPEMVFLKGNHESFLLKFLENSALLDEWRQYGGLETLVSYGLKPPINPTPFERTRLAHAFASVLPGTHRKFLQALKLSFICGDFLFVHAGLRPLIPIQQQKEDDLLWIRDDFLLWDKEFDKIIVHGHTPVLEPDIRFNRINIDTGAFATGRLTCMMIEGTEIMPLIDVRDWIRELPDTEISRSEMIGSDDFPEAEAVNNIKHAGSRKGTRATDRLAQNPNLVAAIHAKRLKEDVTLYDENSLARVDPRRRPRTRTDVTSDQTR